jgi:hypothetical protein
LGDLDVDGRITLKWTFRVRECMNGDLIRVTEAKSSGGLFGYGDETSGCIKSKESLPQN